MEELVRQVMHLMQGYGINCSEIKGKTPAEVVGIKIEGENKWLTLIQNASLKRSNIKKILKRMEPHQ